MFQSLFSWNLLLMRRLDVVLSALAGVSILVFVELALDDQFLLMVMALGTWCFNPCFRGTCS